MWCTARVENFCLDFLVIFHSQPPRPQEQVAAIPQPAASFQIVLLERNCLQKADQSEGAGEGLGSREAETTGLETQPRACPCLPLVFSVWEIFICPSKTGSNVWFLMKFPCLASTLPALPLAKGLPPCEPTAQASLRPLLALSLSPLWVLQARLTVLYGIYALPQPSRISETQNLSESAS